MAQIDLSLGLTLYQYRDRSNREIDFILEDDKNHIFAIEVKGGSRVSVDDFKHIKWFKDNLVKEKEFLGIILYSGENTLYFKDNLVALPISILWEK